MASHHVDSAGHADVYRSLQRAGKPFAAGILYRNDLDYRVAKVLASEVVAEEPFRDIQEDTFQRAMKILEKAGAIGALTRLLRPFLGRLFPSLEKDSPAL